MITSVGKFVARIRGNSCLVVLFSHQVEKKFHKQKTVFLLSMGTNIMVMNFLRLWFHL